MIRTITITSAFLLVTSSIVYAEDKQASLLNLEVEQQYWHRTDVNMSPQEYDEIYNHNKRFILKNLMSYSENALDLIGMPEQGINLMGAALGLVFNDSKLNLNKSKTLALVIKDVRDSDRTLHFGVNLDW
ncbi:MAG: hypothetical protein ABFS45_22300 [Pseudomonadota bacterium]